MVLEIRTTKLSKSRIFTITGLVIIVIGLVYVGLDDQRSGISYILIVGALLGILSFVILSRPSQRLRTGVSSEPTKEKLQEESSADLKVKRDELILDLIKRSYDSEVNRFNLMDNKGGNLIGFVSVIVAILVGLSGFEFLKEISTSWIAIPYFIGLSMLVTSISCALFAIKIRKYRSVPHPSHLMGRYLEADYSLVIRGVAATMRDSINRSVTINETKAKWINRSWYFLIAGLFLIVIFIIIIAISGEVASVENAFPSPRIVPVQW
jgi:drug/metabolite transporter (DMT)-like permease